MSISALCFILIFIASHFTFPAFTQAETFVPSSANSAVGNGEDVTKDPNTKKMLETVSTASAAARTNGAPSTSCSGASPMTYPKSDSKNPNDIDLSDQIGMRVQNENGNCGIYSTYQGVQGVYRRAGYEGYIDPNDVFTKTIDTWSKASDQKIAEHQRKQKDAGLENVPFLLGLGSEETFKGVSENPDGYQIRTEPLKSLAETANNSAAANNPETTPVSGETGKSRSPAEIKDSLAGTAQFLKETSAADSQNIGKKTPSLKELGVVSITAYAPSAGEYQDHQKAGYRSGFPKDMDINEKDQIMEKVSTSAEVKKNANQTVAKRLNAALENKIPVRLEINSKYLSHHEAGGASGHAVPDSLYRNSERQGLHAVTVYGRFKSADGRTYYRVADSNYSSTERDRITSGRKVGARLISEENLYDAQRLDIFLSKDELSKNPWKE